MLWLKKFRKGKLQSSMIFLMILICTLLMTGSLVMLTSLQKPYRQLQEEVNAPDLKARPVFPQGEGQGDYQAVLEKLDCVEKVIPLGYHLLTETMRVDGEELNLFASLVTYDKDVYRDVRLLKGSMDELKEDGCFISSTMANEYGLEVGQKVSIYREKDPYELEIQAVFADTYSLNIAFQVEILVKQIPDGFTAIPNYAVYLEDGKNGSDLSEEYGTAVEGIVDLSFSMEKDIIQNASLTGNILGGIMLVISVVIFIVCSMMIRYMIRNALMKDRRTIAVYKSIGYTDCSIIRIYLTFYMVLSIAGTVLGAAASPLISNMFMREAYNVLGAAVIQMNYLPGILCVLAVDSIVLIQVIMELNKIKKLKPVLVFSGNEQELGRKKNRRAGSGKMGFSPLNMAVRLIIRDRKNTALIIVTCFLSIYMVNIALACFSNIGTMKKNNYYWLGFDEYDICLEASGSLEQFEEISGEIEKDKRVEKVVLNNMETGFYASWGEYGSGYLYESYEGLNMPLVEGRNPLYDNEIAMGNLYMVEQNKKIGDYVELYIGNKVKESLLIVGTFQGFYNLGKGARMLGSTFAKNGIQANYNSASLYLKHGTGIQEFIEDIQEKYGERVKLKLREERFASVLDKIIEPQKSALGPFTILTVMIGGLNIIYIVYFKNANSRKSHSIYKSIGYSSGHLLRMNLYYMGIIGAVSLIAAIPVTIFGFPKMMVLAMSMFGFGEYLVDYNIAGMISGNLGLYMIFILSALCSSFSLYENHIVELVQE